ncbi:DNA-dependent metalloprotease dvc-1 [Battus philenor]|uniref:DNA-dependent metalloprotease dvc-1 n=1 Tax=Battus philenor TaxID=42288 RepID=UPI0035D0CE67
MNLADPELELIDPTPNIHNLFIQFDKLFFWAKLCSRAVVRWSKRMYSCAGICSYEGRKGLCDIALSEPLLKLRPRKDLVETLLHEMIHAFLFITSRDQDRDGHGPNFKHHMHRINNLAGVNITIYHDFHDEVKLYLTHWWRCNGPCQTKRPYFGIVRRTVNRAPGPSDYWWTSHQKVCGGTFIKIKEPENKAPKRKSKSDNGDITKYINNNNSKDVLNKNIVEQPKKSPKEVLISTGNTRNINHNVNVFIQNINTSNSQINKVNNKGQLDGNRRRTQSVVETVRNVWANKQLSGYNKDSGTRCKTTNDLPKPNKHKSVNDHPDTPPNKINKIDNYFTKAQTILKDVYGEDFKISKSKTDDKLILSKVNYVDCPICNGKVKDDDINRHLDECLNKGVIDRLCKDSKPTVILSIKIDNPDLVQPVPDKTKPNPNIDRGSQSKRIKVKTENIDNFTDNKKYSNILNDVVKKEKSVDSITPSTSKSEFNKEDVDKVKKISKKINYENHLRKSGNFVETVKKENDVDFGYLPSFLDDLACEIKLPAVKIEPGGSNVVDVLMEPKCPCCGKKITKPIQEHLDECLAFFENSTAPEEGASTSFSNETIIIDDDDDIFDETQTLNATGTKSPCPCCLQMVEQADMNHHLDICLSS